MNLKTTFSAVALAVAALSLIAPASAKTLRWASAGEIASWDPHSQNNALANGIHASVYEALVTYNKKFEVEGVLATSWKQVNPLLMRFTLRKGVKFSDGSAFTADDVVFSINRAMGKESNFGIYVQGITSAVKVDDFTVDINTATPNPVLIRQLTEVRIMSKAWAAKNNSVTAKDMKIAAENFAHRNAMGTGRFMLTEWKPDQKMVMKRNPNWWGKLEGNLTEVVYTPIKSDATRVAALLSGEIDMVIDPSPQDQPRLRQDKNIEVIDGAENRTIFLGMDQFRDELVGSSVKGKNPLKDIRVRKALYQAVEIEAIHKNIMRGLSQTTALMVSPQVNGWRKDLDVRHAYNLEASKKLLAEAGYPNGFEVDFACPNNRYINDEAICQAVTGMWAKIGVKAKLRTLPLVSYFPMILRNEASIYMLGWGVPTFDALYSLQSLLRTVGLQGDGNYNVGRYSNPQMDGLVERIKKETDQTNRRDLIGKALKMAHDDVAYIPLHNQIIPWAVKKNVSVVHRADNRVDMRWVSVK